MQPLPPSLWAATAPAAPDCPPLTGVSETEVAVVGGGFTGLSSALHLAKEGKNVVVLEAVEPGWGASGRNGGQVNPGLKILPQEIESRWGPERGARLVAMASSTCDLVFDLIREYNINCDAVRPGYVQGSVSAPGRKGLEDWVRQWTERGVDTKLLDRGEVGTLLGTEHYESGFLDKRGGNLQPLAYARGLATAAMTAGATIHGASPVQTISRRGASWSLRTANGSLNCRHVVLGTNGYTDHLWPGLRRTVVPLASFVAATTPLSDNLLKSILPQRNAVSETTRVGVYYRMDAQGRFVIGGRGNLFDLDQMGDDTHLRRQAVQLFPQLEAVDWEFHWGGYVAMTPAHAPKLMKLDHNVYAGVGYNGRGVAMATMMGKQLALAVMGQDPDMPISALDPIAFHAFRQVGISYRLVSGQWLDQLTG